MHDDSNDHRHSPDSKGDFPSPSGSPSARQPSRDSGADSGSLEPTARAVGSAPAPHDDLKVSDSKLNERKTKSVAQLANALRELEGALSAWDQETIHKAPNQESASANRRDAQRGISPDELRRKTRELLIELKAQIDEL
jgi:hypothetical protein